MVNFANSTRIPTTDVIKGRNGNFRTIVKCRAGFMTVEQVYSFKNARVIDVFRSYYQKSLQTIQFQPEGQDGWFTVFARKGNKVVVMDEELFMTMKVGDINQEWSKTNLYSQTNYQIAGAKTWEDYAFKIK